MCSGCGREDRAGGDFCPSCGARLQKQQPLPGILDSRYEILSLIKSGGMGSVFRAHDRRLDCDVAIKQMISSFRDQAEADYAEKRFREEARLLSRLHHSGLPKVIDYFSEIDRATGNSANYLVMTYIEGHDLETGLSAQGRKPIAVARALSWLRQMLAILIYLHSQNPPVIYRDMKPSNIMIDGEKLYLVDFGIARLFIPSRTATMIGTPGYAAPEQYKGFSEPRSDIYSLGVVMHYLLTGRNPEDSDRPPFHFEPPRRLNAQVPRYLDELIASMLEFQAEMRPQSAERIMQILNDERVKGGHLSVKSLLRPAPSLPAVPHAGLSDIFRAIESGNPQAVEGFLKAGADPETARADGVTPLHCAAEKGSAEIAEILIAAGAVVNTATRAGCTALHITAVTNDMQIARLLISSGADADTANAEGRTPLHRASFWGHAGLVALFLNEGAEVDRQDMEGQTPLHLAVQEGRIDAAESLLKAGASPDKKDRSGMTPLHLAAQRGHAETSELLMSYGALYDCCDCNQNTPLHLAAERGHKAVASMLLDAGAEINAVNVKGETPLHLAAKGNIQMAAYLLKRGADCQARDLAHTTPLQAAFKAGEHEIVNLLRRSGSYLDVFEAIEKRDEEAVRIFAENREHLKPDGMGFSPLHRASERGQAEMADLMLRYNAPVNCVNRQNETPLHLAARHGHTGVVSTLLRYHADPDFRTVSLTTPLHEAAQQGHAEIAALMLKSGAKCNCRDDQGSTPLHLAAEKGHCDVITLLLSEGAEMNAWNRRGHTPLCNAVLCRRHDARRLLRGAGAYYDVFEAVRREDHEALSGYLSAGAPVGIRNRLGQTPLHRMAARDLPGEAERFIAAGADVNAADRAGMTPLHYASRKGHIAAAEMLISKGASLCALDRHLRTPLALSLLHRKPEMAETLRAAGACRDVFDALDRKNMDAVKKLLQSGIDLEEKNAAGSALIHIASAEGHAWLVRYLIARGINLNSRDGRGFTAVRIARMAGQREIIEILKAHRARGGGPLGLW